MAAIGSYLWKSISSMVTLQAGRAEAAGHIVPSSYAVQALQKGRLGTDPGRKRQQGWTGAKLSQPGWCLFCQAFKGKPSSCPVTFQLHFYSSEETTAESK